MKAQRLSGLRVYFRSKSHHLPGLGGYRPFISALKSQGQENSKSESTSQNNKITTANSVEPTSVCKHVQTEKAAAADTGKERG